MTYTTVDGERSIERYPRRSWSDEYVEREIPIAERFTLLIDDMDDED